MNKYLKFLFLSLLVIAISGCEKGNESPLLFEVRSNTNPEDILLSYNTDETGYYIDVKTNCNGDLELACSNCNDLDYTIDCTYSILVPEEHTYRDVQASKEQVGVIVKIYDGYQLSIHFDKLLDRLPTDFLCAEAEIKIYGKVGGKDVNTKFSIRRLKPLNI